MKNSKNYKSKKHLVRLVVDTNLFPIFFSGSGKLAKLFDFIFIKKRGRVYFGGKKYLDEIGRITTFNKLINELKDKNLILVKDVHEVDKIEQRIIQLCKNKKLSNSYNDHHVIALISASKADICCTEDKTTLMKQIVDVFKFIEGNKPSFYNDDSKHYQDMCRRYN